MGSKQKTDTTDTFVKIQRTDLLPTYHYPEPRAEEEAQRRRSRNETWIKDYPTGTFHNVRDVTVEWTKPTSARALLVGLPREGRCMWIDKRATMTDGQTKATSFPVDTIDGWRSQGKLESEYQASIHDPKKPPTKTVKEKSSGKKKSHLPDVPAPRVRVTAVRCSVPRFNDTSPGPAYLPERWPFH